MKFSVSEKYLKGHIHAYYLTQVGIYEQKRIIANLQVGVRKDFDITKLTLNVNKKKFINIISSANRIAGPFIQPNYKNIKIQNMLKKFVIFGYFNWSKLNLKTSHN